MTLTHAPETPLTRRATTSAAPSTEWRARSACRTTDPDVFFSTRKRDQAQARRVCTIKCPVVAECLRWQIRFDERTYRWGIGGGLTEMQRRALEMEERLGHVPDLALAVRLGSHRWRFRVQQLRKAHPGLEGVVEGLREGGLAVDEVTVRVALWWEGDDGSRLPRRQPGDVRPLGRLLREDHGALLTELRGTGMRIRDVAAYLGVALTSTNVAINALEQVKAA